MRTTHTLRTRSTHSGLLAALPLYDAGSPASRAPRRLTLSLLAAVLLALLIPAASSAAQTHVFLGTFCAPTGLGAAPCEPTFEYSKAATVDQTTGDVLIVEAESAQISRFHSDGTPADFSALASNVIDGKEPGPDATPQEGLSFNAGPQSVQIAVDESGTATDGNIYVTQNTNGGGSLHAVDVFAPDGSYLGQLTGAGATSFASATGDFGATPCGVAVDSDGDLYVSSPGADAIYKFDPSGSAPTNADHLTTFSSPGACALAAGAGPSAGSLFVVESNSGSRVFKLNAASGALLYSVLQYSDPNTHPEHLSVDPGSGHLLTTASNGDDREYDASGPAPSLIATVTRPSNGASFDNASGRLYVLDSDHLRVYGPLVPLPEASTVGPSSIGETTATFNGTVETFGQELTECKFEYGPTSTYGATIPCVESPSQIGTGFAKVHADVTGLAGEALYHLRLTVANANGPAQPQGSDQSFETVGKPRLLSPWAQDVTLHEATLKAQLNPQGATTTYRFEWGLSEAPYEHITADIAIGSGFTPQTVSLFLQGLQTGTTYHYRLLAANHCHPETGPATLCTSEAPDHSFTTFKPSPPPETDCSNQALRTAASAFLPDCRAYEMVSPVDKNGGDIVSNLSTVGDPGGYVQVTADGAKLTYGVAFAAFAGEPASLIFNQYMAERGGGGWSNEGIHPPVNGRAGSLGLTREFSIFSADLCSAWLEDDQAPALNPDAQQGYPNLYRRQNCGAGAGSLETLTPSPPALPSGTAKAYVNVFSVQGLSEDGSHAFFLANTKLNDEAAEGGNSQIYDRFGGENHLVSVLPGGAADGTPTAVGSGSAGYPSAGSGNLDNAVAEDGSPVYWTSAIGNAISGEGKIFVRSHPEQGRVENECDLAGATACTRAVSAGTGAFYWTAAKDGSKALYREGENLFEFDLARAEHEEPPRRLIAHHLEGVAGASEDLSRIYFVSTDALNGGSEGEEAGKPNLYLEQGTTIKLVATLGENVATPDPYYRPTRVTPDGTRIVFESRAPMTGYDNVDPVTGKPAVEVFSYEAGGDLICVSCNPSGARPSGVRELRLPYAASFAAEASTKVPAAAWIPTSEHKLHASNVLSADGTRIFFNANDALLPRDTNGAPDVYEWEAPGAGRCTEQSPSFFASNGGCLYLISSGQSPSESEFWEATPDGSDVFFTTSSSLLPQDPGSVDLYDARVEGGFPQPTVPAACEGEACQSPPAPPNDPTPASSSFEGAGNVVEPSAKKCPKGKVKKHARCAKKAHKKKHKRHAKRGRGAR